MYSSLAHCLTTRQVIVCIHQNTQTGMQPEGRRWDISCDDTVCSLVKFVNGRILEIKRVCSIPSCVQLGILHTYRVIQEESAILWEMVVCVILSKTVHMNMGPILNRYRDMVKRRYGLFCEHEQQLRNK
jgi:hypothetical protein